MTASGKAAKKPTLVLRKSSAKKPSSGKLVLKRKTEPEPVKPKKKLGKPKVDEGPYAVKSWKDGTRTVARFFVAQFCGTQPWWMKRTRERGVRGPFESKWYVMDVESGKRAARTKEEGYDTVNEAREVAREYGKKYGYYTEVPF